MVPLCKFVDPGGLVCRGGATRNKSCHKSKIENRARYHNLTTPIAQTHPPARSDRTGDRSTGPKTSSFARSYRVTIRLRDGCH
jgi:hypothetical protein